MWEVCYYLFVWFVCEVGGSGMLCECVVGI